MMKHQSSLADLIAVIPRLFFLLRAVGDDLNADLGVNTSMRGVMLSLATGPRTVPDLARERPVSRQHIQSVVNQLLDAGIVRTAPNPSHRRSALIALTEEGERRLRLIQRRESELLAGFSPSVSGADLAATLRLLALVEQDLASRVRRLEEA